MASSTILSLYSPWSNYAPDPYVSLDDDNNVSLSGYRHTGGPGSPEVRGEKFSTVDLNARSNCMSAVDVKDAVLSYGRGKKVVHALRGVNLRVPAGGIYGLLGPSGCGKTTLLRCIIGRLSPQKGEVEVFGEKPGVSGSLIPGPDIGYMPQDIALYPDFTIEETLMYFGRLFQMNAKFISERIEFLMQFLQLCEKSRFIGNLSGGQKRRVSLAVALVHNPPLVVLDEPTVGVDPVLRQAIWDHLVDLTSTGCLTVIITTHYIEEARAANIVGLMRSGRLLIEANPNYLLRRFQRTTLEEVFLHLCQMNVNAAEICGTEESLKSNAFAAENKPDICATSTLPAAGQNAVSFSARNATVEGTEDIVHIEKSNHRQQPSTEMWKKFSKTSALCNKNLVRLRRNLPVLLFQFLLPSIEVILFCLCIGRDPFDIPVAIVNNEQPTDLSFKFLESIDKSIIIQVVNVDFQREVNNTQLAIEAVEKGDCWAALIIGSNFSVALRLRMILEGGVDNETVRQSNVEVHLDMTNQLIGYKIQRTLLESFQNFAKNMLIAEQQNPALVELPVQFVEPVYGGEPTFTEFMAPGVLLSITFLAAVALTALAFVMERKEGLLERSLVAGVTSFEFLLSHILTQLLVVSVQIFLLLIFTFLVFQVPCRCSFIWVILMTLLQGCCGMSYGLMISALCKEENSATMLALGSFYPNLLLSGTVWPTQAMPAVMRYISYVLPQTLPIESMRYMLSRGWGPEFVEVASGFAVTIVWTLLFLFFAILIFKVKK
ncbi:ABC transporter G family member 20-like protein [Leptotrombidium deliense]|uniref:ABC transporter G family member 20-like protein n=1 Tax=Leptotrombidium deliense TaxID=299467 RepID=A0A443SJ40_9ACAR|nr:ABC transporter G family member 20-like protein [Leptotrombidium deliense]